MKKVILMTMLSLLTIAVLSDMLTVKVSRTVKKQFENEFKDAANVLWRSNERWQKATFQLEGNRVSAFYNSEDKYLGAIQIVKYEELPLEIRSKIKKTYVGYSVKEVIQVVSRPKNVEKDDTGFYGIELVNAKEQVYLSVNPSAQIGVYKKTKQMKNLLAMRL